MNRNALTLDGIAQALRAAGVPVMSISESDVPELEDDELAVTPDVTVQVGYDYLIANRWSECEQAMYHGENRDRNAAGVALLASDLQQFMAVDGASRQQATT